MCVLSDDRALLGHNRPPNPQIRRGDSRMDDAIMAEPRTDDHAGVTQCN
ncbi:hypothetical protein BVRB_9g213350 [Beta vulgaris subsp. vulgaris]|nr:hypothetical protein BVRB_9g213350 [Beta vulgaris subsp. vulgaris]